MKQVKQVLHRKSEAESAKNLANWQIYPLFLLAASPEIILFLPPCLKHTCKIFYHDLQCLINCDNTQNLDTYMYFSLIFLRNFYKRVHNFLYYLGLGTTDSKHTFCIYADYRIVSFIQGLSLVSTFL